MTLGLKQTLWNIKTSFRALQGVDVSRLVIKSKAIPGCCGMNAEVSAALWPGVANKIGALEVVVDAEHDSDEVEEEDTQRESSVTSADESDGGSVQSASWLHCADSQDGLAVSPLPERSRSPSNIPSAPGQEQIFVKTLTGRTLSFYVDLNMPTSTLEALVALRDAGSIYGARRWCLSHAYSGVKLLPERTLVGNKVRKESTLQMIPQYGSAAWWPLDPTGVLARANRGIGAV